MLDIDDAEYEEEEAKLTQQMKNSLDTIDQEIEKQAVEIFEAQKQVWLVYCTYLDIFRKITEKGKGKPRYLNGKIREKYMLHSHF